MDARDSRCLDGLRVVDMTRTPGQLAGRILADLGADVVLVESPGGDSEGVDVPLLGDSAGRGTSWVARNLGKRGVEIDLRTPAGRERLRELTSRSDVLVADQASAVDVAALRRDCPSLVVATITPFGYSGPRASYRGSDLTTLAASGNMFMTGDAERPPLRCSMPVSHYHAGAETAAAILMALYQRDRNGRGEHVDVSVQELMVMTNVSHTAQAWSGAFRGQRRGGAYRAGDTIQREIWRCKDGHVTFALRGGAARVPGLIAMTELMDEVGMATPVLKDRDWGEYNHNLLSQGEVDAMSEAFSAFFRTRTMAELYEAACERRLMLAPANSESQVLASRQLASRDFFVTSSACGELRIPRSFAVADGIRARDGLPEGGAGEGFAGVGFGVGGADFGSEKGKGRGKGVGIGGGIFSGLKVVEFGAGAAAPLATRYFADQGATVVKVESRRRPDFLRTLRDDGSGNLDGSLFFACINPNKRSAGLNMKDPRGVDVARRLIGWADVVVENFAPGVMAKWGIDYANLEGDNPGLVMASTCLWGQTGPERAYPGFGGQGAALAGFNHLTGWPDGDPVGPFGTITDSLSPRFTVVAITAALLRRARTGRGAYIDVSQVETGVYCLTEWLLAFQATGESFGRIGNQSRNAVPHGVFPAAGDDRWIAIAIHSDVDWRALRKAMAEPEWAAEPDLDTLAGRLAARPTIEEKVAEWTSRRLASDLESELQAAGLDACAVLDLQDVLRDPQLSHRDHFRRLSHPIVGEHVAESIGARFASSPMTFERAAPCLAADNDYVYGELLGLSREEVDELTAEGVLA